ncbi:hypothetical protein [Sphingomicrobium arenosum]|uniref:hypothetical protein n=1 Tax=Sphingomicrobium arenosum TaxID=2233861 RepID=UPI002240FDD3|nr:hypothetical protein [Sphingomicrobium arenosum]
MKQISLLIGSALLVTACARTEPVSEEELDEVVVETPALGEGADDDGPAALPADAMSWQMVEGAAVLGNDPASPALSIACGDNDDGLVLTRYGAPGSGSAGTLTIVGNGTSARVPVVAAEAGEEDQFNWTATLARGELASSISTAFAADEPVNITATGVDPIVVTAGGELRGLLERCVGSAEEESEIGDAPLIAEETPAAE